MIVEKASQICRKNRQAFHVTRNSISVIYEDKKTNRKKAQEEKTVGKKTIGNKPNRKKNKRK